MRHSTTPVSSFGLGLLLCCLLHAADNTAAGFDGTLALLPPRVELSTPESRQQVLVQWQADQGPAQGEWTSQQLDGITWASSDPQVATVEQGLIRPSGNGQATVTARVGEAEASLTVVVRGLEDKEAGGPFPWSFRHHVEPVLAKLGCNSGACHGALAGKGGFRLSLRGYDPPTDYFNIVQQDRGRRIEWAQPARSLVLAKPSGAIRHKGGLRLETDSLEYRILSEWIAAGAAPPREDDAQLERLEVLPGRSIHRLDEQQQLIVRAYYSDGRQEDVTRWVKWSSANEAVCRVDEQGLATMAGPGEGAVVAWFASRIAIARITVPFAAVAQPAVASADPRPARGFIDTLIDRQLQRLNLPASAPCSDSEFVRRVYLDTIGRLPTTDETTRFLADPGEGKRDALIDRLLDCEEFVDYWTYKWSDVLMLNGTLLRPAALKAYYQWIRGQVAANSPWDVFVREVLTATGSSVQNGATNFFALHQSPEDMVENASQAFLGLSIGCAKCHNHPLEKWTNDEYYSVANLFSRVKAKGWGGEPRSGDGVRTLYVVTSGELVQPRTGKPQPPAPLDGQPIDFDDPTDRRVHFARWLTSADNPYFARSIANRVWANFFGVGLVEQVDDMRVSNPASNEELLTALAEHLAEQKFDLKSLMRVMLQSNAYQRSSQPLPANVADTRFYSHYYPRRLMAEVLHDAIVQVTGVPTRFDAVAFPGADRQKTDFYPLGTKAIQLYDSAVENYFLKTFGRNQRRIVCECERSDEPTIVQVLHLSNGSTINDKLRDETSRVAEWLRLRRTGRADATLLDELYLTCLSRYPTPAERESLLQLLPPSGDAEERAVLEDLAWGLMSSREFIFNH